MAKGKNQQQEQKQEGPKMFYRQDMAGVWVFIKSGDNEILITKQPITSPHDIDEIKQALKAA